MDEDDKYIAPTILVDITPSDAIMQEEVKSARNLFFYSFFYLFVCVHTCHNSNSDKTMNLNVYNSVCFQIFGPVLPIINVEDADEAIAFINSRFAFPTILLKLAEFTHLLNSIHSFNEFFLF